MRIFKNFNFMFLFFMLASIAFIEITHAQYYPQPSPINQRIIDQYLQRQVFGSDIIHVNQTLRLEQQLRMGEQVVAISLEARAAQYQNATASLFVNNQPIGQVQVITGQSRRLDFPLMQMMQLGQLTLRIQGSAIIDRISAHIQSSHMPPTPGGPIHARAQVSRQVYGQEMIQVAQEMRRSGQQLRGLKLLRVALKARVMGNSYGNTAQLIINGQAVSMPQQISQLAVRFHPGQFQNLTLGQEIQSMQILVRGNVFVEDIEVTAIRGAVIYQPNPHQGGGWNNNGNPNQGGGWNNNPNNGGGWDQQGDDWDDNWSDDHSGQWGQQGQNNNGGSSNGGNYNGNGNGQNSQGNGGQWQGQGSGGSNNSGGTGAQQGTIGDQNSKSIELPIMRSLADKDTLKLADLISKVHPALKSKAIIKIELTAAKSTDKEARVIIRSGQNLLGALTFNNEESKSVSIDAQSLITLDKVELSVREGVNISVAKISFQ